MIERVEYYEEHPYGMKEGAYKPCNFYVVKYKTGRYRTYESIPKTVLEHIGNLKKVFLGYDKYEGYNMYLFQ